MSWENTSIESVSRIWIEIIKLLAHASLFQLQYTIKKNHSAIFNLLHTTINSGVRILLEINFVETIPPCKKEKKLRFLITSDSYRTFLQNFPYLPENKVFRTFFCIYQKNLLMLGNFTATNFFINWKLLQICIQKCLP